MGRQVALAVLLEHEHPTDRKRAVRKLVIQKLVVQKLPVPDRLLQIAIRIAIEERRHGNLHAIDPMFDLMTDLMVELMSKVQVEMDQTEVMEVEIQMRDQVVLQVTEHVECLQALVPRFA